MYQKAAAAGASEVFHEQRLVYDFKIRIFCVFVLKEVLQLKNEYFCITISCFKLFLFNRKEAITITNKGKSC